ncbi:EAL domain-containing protein [Shewanella algae]|uniref:EAL domain-containing protein n=1 Tax=Shewanella algae TaxID=38313 RepID=UPI001AAC4B9E|nr:bifunctional diguanylate cyclase/phosphodiesterase [Shewanella algae]MBO2557110.1 EAL domain-containing protein [Shewanella algae]MBO2574044.1 EAL domain-containing protein [Shewanella algae]MBO2637489.1 EAL domain-containing protein [Shewanella algae]
MTLYRRILVWMLLAFALLTIGSSVGNFIGQRGELVRLAQQRLDSQLGALSYHLSNQSLLADESLTERILNTVFSSREFSELSLVYLDNRPPVLQSLEADPTFPEWFRAMMALPSLEKKVRLSEQEQPLAVLSLRFDHNLILISLWHSLGNILLYWLVILLTASLLLAWVLKKSLAPLTRLQQSALSMVRSRATQPLEEPALKELALLARAFNHVETQLKEHLRQQASEAEKFRSRAYQDPVSELGNRSYLMNQLDSWLAQPGQGGLALLRLDSISLKYQFQDYEAGDQQVREIAQRLQELVQNEFSLARLNSAEFVLLAPNVSEEELKALGLSMLHMALETQSDPLGLTPDQAAVALVMRSEQDQTDKLLQQADKAITQAMSQKGDKLVMVSSASTLPEQRGKQEWRALVDEAIANHLFAFQFQRALDMDNQPLHKEVFAYIAKDGKHYNAGEFMAAIEQLGGSTLLDMHLIGLLFEQQKQAPKSVAISINISPYSANDPSFIRWLGNLMQANTKLAGSILIEIPEICFIRYCDNTALLCEQIHQAGFDFGIDGFGHHFSSIDYLDRFRPAYLKLAFGYTASLADDAQTDALVSLTRISSNLDIITIASRVETEAQRQKLKELGVDGYQGYMTDRIYEAMS